jgi:hypothetical protein
MSKTKNDVEKMKQTPKKPDTIEEVLAIFSSPEAVEDERIWQEKFNATPAKNLHQLADKIRGQIREGKVSPLDFTNR